MLEGYYFRHAQCVAQFLPQLNLIWIQGEEKNFYEVLDEEFFHFASAGLNPAHLLPLYNSLCDIASEPHAIAEIDNFRDILESLFLAYQKISGKISNFNNMEIREEYILLAEEIIALYEELNQNAMDNNEEYFKIESFKGLSLFLLHVIPKGKNKGREIVRCFRQKMPIAKWEERYDLFCKLYKHYNRLLTNDVLLANLFQLSYPIDYHRIAGELFVFLRASILLIEKGYYEDILPFVLSFIDIFSLGSLIVIPMIAVQKRKKILEIGISHTLSSSEVLIKRIISVSQARICEQENQKVKCFFTRFFKHLLEESGVFRISQDGYRIVMFMEFFMKFMRKMLEDFDISDYNCKLCKNTCKAIIFPYRELLLKGVIRNESVFTKLSREYENWFVSYESVKWMRDNLKNFPKVQNFELIKRYDYL